MRITHLSGRITALAALMAAPAALAMNAVAGASQSAPGPASGELAKLIFGLLAVVVVVLGLSRLLVRFGGFRAGGNADFRVLSSLIVGQKERVVLLQLGSRQLLLGVGPGQVRTLHVLEEPLAAAEGRADPAAAGDPGRYGWLVKALARKG